MKISRGPGQQGAFRDILDRWRKPLRKLDEDPFGKEPSENISKKVLDAVLVGKTPKPRR
jgi:hypothetical protein